MSHAPVDMARAEMSPSYAKTIWTNYYKCENTVGATATQIAQIEAWWENKIPEWCKSTATDDNKYIIEDEKWDDAQDRGYKRGQEIGDYENTGWQKTGQIARCAGDATVSVGGAVTRVAAKKAIQQGGEWVMKQVAGKSFEKAGQKAVEKASEEAIKKAGEEAVKKTAEETAKAAGKELTEEATKKALEEAGEEGIKKAGEEAIAKEGAEKASANTCKNAGILIACAFDAASAIAYRIKNPNKTQHEAVMKVNEQHGTLQSESGQVQTNLSTWDGELMDQTDTANEMCETSSDDMSEQKTDYDVYARQKEYLDKAKTQGHIFTKEEAEMYKEAVAKMTEKSKEAGDTKDVTHDNINEIYEDMAEYQSNFDESGEKIAEIDGVTEYAEGIDESTQAMCYVEGGVQTLNAGFAAFDAYKAASAASASAITIGGAIAYGAAAVAAGAAAVSDGFAAKDQFTWAGEVGQEIENRNMTEDINAVSTEEYNENTDYYAEYMEDVEGLEIVVPDDMEAPEDAEVPEVGEEETEESKKASKEKEEKERK